MKKTKRKAFNFLRSYFDVLNELEKDSDKLSFLTSIINKQFLNEDPNELKFIAKLCYESQRHSIESSVKGWIRANKTDLQGYVLDTPRTDPPTNPPTNPKEEEGEEEVQEKEKVQEKVKEYITIEEKEDFFIKASSKYKMYAEQLFKDNVFIEALSRNQIKDPNKDVCKNTIHKYLKLFLSHLDEYKHVHDNKKQFSANFSNWLRKQKIVKVYPEQKQIRYS